MSKTLTEWLSEMERLDKEATKGPYYYLSTEDPRFAHLIGYPGQQLAEVAITNGETTNELLARSRTELPRAVEVIRCLWRNMEFQFGEDEDRVTAEIEKILNGDGGGE